jgi:hypothetical protein
MSRDREQLLAEGPRVAPEPRTIDAFDPGSEKFVIREEGATGDGAVPRKPSSQGVSIGRLIVPLLFVGFFVAQFVGVGGYAWVLLLVAIGLGSLLAERGGKEET